MNRLVYLFELDSVIKTETPKKKRCCKTSVVFSQGAKALFSEIINNGNSVAITMNQLADSEFFAQALCDDYAYPRLLTLFEKGALCVSIYKKSVEFGNQSVRTVSQYVQEAVEKALRSDGGFIFTNVPVDKNDVELLSAMGDSLRNSDLELLAKMKESAKTEERKWQIETVYRFVNLVLRISVNNSSNLPEKQTPGKSFEFFMGKAISLLSKSPDYADLTQELQCVSELVTEGRNSRSKWLSAKPNLSPLAQKVINLCYNYAVEDSISEVSKHYEGEPSFQRDFLNRLALDPQNPTSFVSKGLWNKAVRFSEYATGKRKTDSYESGYGKERAKWVFHLLKRNALSFLYTLGYVAIFILVELGMDLLKEFFPVSFSGWMTIIGVIIFGFIGAFIDRIIKLIFKHDIPDLFDSVSGIFVHFIDLLSAIKGGNDDSYRLH